MRFSVYQESHIGGRKVNQDRMGYSFTRDALLLLLADGMGGHIKGEMAATIAMQTITPCSGKKPRLTLNSRNAFWKKVLWMHITKLCVIAMQYQLPETPRTTIVACLIQHGTLSGRIAAILDCIGCVRDKFWRAPGIIHASRP